MFLVNPLSSILGIWTAGFWAQKLRDILYCTIGISLGIGIPITVCCQIDIADTIDLFYLPTSCVPLFLADAAPTGPCRRAKNRWNRKRADTPESDSQPYQSLHTSPQISICCITVQQLTDHFVQHELDLPLQVVQDDQVLLDQLYRVRPCRNDGSY